ncbi:MAG: hypothetical protein FWH03_06220 [Firmicutes bacterium]|nr:hypothetical protein [Bacillota bacterium]
MNTKKIEKAKKIFISNYGDEYSMQRNGDYFDYKKYNISKETEQLWREEQKNEIKIKLPIEPNPIKVTSLIRTFEHYVKESDYNDTFAVEYLYERYLKLDTVTNLESCEAIYRHRRIWDLSLREKLAVVLKHILTGDLKIFECYKTPLYHDDFSEAALKERAQKLLNEIM